MILLLHNILELLYKYCVPRSCMFWAKCIGMMAVLFFKSKVFQEVLRLYPPAPAFDKEAPENLKLSGYSIPKGTAVKVSSTMFCIMHAWWLTTHLQMDTWDVPSFVCAVF